MRGLRTARNRLLCWLGIHKRSFFGKCRRCEKQLPVLPVPESTRRFKRPTKRPILLVYSIDAVGKRELHHAARSMEDAGIGPVIAIPVFGCSPAIGLFNLSDLTPIEIDEIRALIAEKVPA